VANGWYDRTLAEHQFWKQSNHVVQGKKLWETLRERRPGFTCAKLFWWYNMYSTADWSITPRPMYPADGRKVFDVYTHPMRMRDDIKADLGPFPFPSFWGPLAGIKSSEWIARSAEWVEERHEPDLSLVYLPHLDYNLQRLGPDDPRMAFDYREIDRVVGGLIDFYARAIWWRFPRRTRGSLTTIGTTTRRRRILRAASISTANTATIPWSCSSILRSRSRS
jgi:predicted AlkP superfamily pyrophosphatase or phosphodiesterase